MRPPADPLSTEIGLLADAWLSIHCPRGRSVDYPLKLMAMRHRPTLTLRAVVSGLVCTCCRRRPVSIHLGETPYSTGQGRAGADPGWKIDLLRELNGQL